MSFKPYPEAVDWNKERISAEVEIALEYEDWLWRMLSLHSDAPTLAAELVNVAAKRKLSAFEARFLGDWVAHPKQQTWLKTSSALGTRRSLRNASMQLDFEYLREVEKYSEASAYRKLEKKYSTTYVQTKRIVKGL